MGLITKPLVPAGPLQVFFDHLHSLHADAGRPSMRDLQRRTRSGRLPNGINPTTIHDTFTAPRLARWEVVEAVVQALGGKVAVFASLWRQARDLEGPQQDPSPQSETAAQRTEGRKDNRANFVIPRELPPDVRAFMGRNGSLAAMDDLLSAAGDQPSAAVIVAMSGTAGVGKTALAVHWAHKVAASFPDGQLYIDLRGYDPDQPSTPHEALAQFLRALGVANDHLPYETVDRAARFRSLVADRRMLIVLDNAASVAQIRQLLPGAASCVVVVTSRDDLAGLVARHGACRITLDLLTESDAVELLRVLIGVRASAELETVGLLANMCSRLPLALRIAAELATSRPDSTLADLANELRDERRRLDLLDAGADERTGVRAVFSWSYRHLSDEAAQMFRLLGIAPHPHVDAPAAAAITGSSLPTATRTLEALTRGCLVHRAADHWAMHDLLRAYAHQLAIQEESEGNKTTALDRLFEHHLATGAAAMDAAFPAERLDRPLVGESDALSTSFSSAVTARAWLDSNRSGLVAGAVYAGRHGRPNHAINSAAILWRYLHNGAYHDDAIAIHSTALEASRQLHDRIAEGRALTNLGTVYWRWGQYQQAAEHYRKALETLRAANDLRGSARALCNLGAIHWQQGDYKEASDTLMEAVSTFQVVGDRHGEARALDNLGAVLQRTGCYAEAAERHMQALMILRDLGDRLGEGRALSNIGVVLQDQQRLAEAAEHHQLAMAILHDVGDLVGEAQAVENLGNVYRAQGRLGEALSHHRKVLATASETGNRSREVAALNSLGITLHALSRPEDARANHEAALSLAREIGDRYEEARGLEGIARAMEATGNPAEARTFWEEAYAVYAEIGSPEAEGIRSKITTGTHPADLPSFD